MKTQFFCVLFCVFHVFVFQLKANNYKYLVWGGGFAPYASELALESNVKFFSQIALGQFAIPSDSIEILFGAGKSSSELFIMGDNGLILYNGCW